MPSHARAALTLIPTTPKNMTLLLLLIPLSLGLLVAAIWAFVWAVRKGQFDDLDTPALDILREDPEARAQVAGTDASSSAQDDPDEGR